MKNRRLLVEKLTLICDNLRRNCMHCYFKDECDSISTSYTPHAWDENEQNTFCELMIRKCDQHDQ